METERLMSGFNNVNPLKVQINKMYLIGLAILIVLCIVFSNLGAKAGSITVRMPDIRPDHAEQYLCMSHRVKKDDNGEFIVGFNPKGDASRVHHMLVYGCERPGIFQRDSPNFVWDCSEMHASSVDGQAKAVSSFEEGPICKGQQQILYGWALDAPALKLPEGVGFKIGGLDSGIEFLVLQVHYGHYEVFQKLPDLTDNSGLVLDVKANEPGSGITKRAGVLLLISLGYVPKGRSKHEIWCDINEDIDVHPFRFRVHTHKLGTRVMGAKMSRAKERVSINSLEYGVDKNTIIGAGNPQDPQMFYPVRESNMTLTRGDSVYASCEFDNNKSKPVRIGSTGDDEMCNFYLMYWTNSPNLLAEPTCYGKNPPQSYVSSLIERYRKIGLF